MIVERIAERVEDFPARQANDAAADVQRESDRVVQGLRRVQPDQGSDCDLGDNSGFNRERARPAISSGRCLTRPPRRVSVGRPSAAAIIAR